MARPGRSSGRTSARLWLASGWLLLAILAAIFAPFVAPHDPLAQDLMLERLPPIWIQGSDPGSDFASRAFNGQFGSNRRAP